MDLILNVTFPVWGIASPLACVFLFLQWFASLQYPNGPGLFNNPAYIAIDLSYSVVCLLLKRTVTFDRISVDKSGIRLPRLMGMSVNLLPEILWKDVSHISAAVPSDGDLAKSQIVISVSRGPAVRLACSQLEPDFVEQFLLAVQMWAPQVCDESLNSMQNSLRLSASGSSQSSYTELWEEELGRRFAPTSYIPLEIGRVLRQSTLKVVNPLSSGGLSALYLCQLNGKELVVLKEAVIPESGTESVREKAREMFGREAHLLMKLDHGGIVHVLDFFSEGERNYLMLEYVNGVDLKQLVKQNGAQRESDVLEWAIQIAGSLKHLHEREQPIIHRDLTPDNIVLRNDGQTVIVDFGAANEFIGTATGTFVGKHSFIAPEQLRGKATTQSDIYAFGCTLFYLLTGSEPEALTASNPKELVPAISDELAELVESCTQLEVRDRYQSVAQMLPVLRRLAAQIMVA